MLRVLITGGAGFLGLHCARILKERECEVSILDIAKFEPEEYPAGVKFIEADVRDFSVLNKVAAYGYDVIIHCAAALPLWRREEIFSVNVDGTQNVLESALKNGVSRVIYISSTAVYGIPRFHPINEEAELDGVGYYGESKILAEELCVTYRRRGLCVPVVRPKTFIGVERLGVFHILYDWVESGKRIPIIGNGNNRYQLLDVEDLVEAIWLLATKPREVVNDTFNIGAKEFGTVLEDVGTLCKYAKTGASVLRTSATAVKVLLRVLEVLGVSPLYRWVYGTADTDSFVSTDKIERAVGWRPKYSNKEALLRSYQWYLTNIPMRDAQRTGITHRVAWSQGVLKLFKKLL